MASITPRKNKTGEIISYQVKVSRGRDALTGKPLTPYTTTYTPPEGWSRKAVERDMARFAGEFEAACKRGEVLTREKPRPVKRPNRRPLKPPDAKPSGSPPSTSTWSDTWKRSPSTMEPGPC